MRNNYRQKSWLVPTRLFCPSPKPTHTHRRFVRPLPSPLGPHVMNTGASFGVQREPMTKGSCRLRVNLSSSLRHTSPLAPLSPFVCTPPAACPISSPTPTPFPP